MRLHAPKPGTVVFYEKEPLLYGRMIVEASRSDGRLIVQVQKDHSLEVFGIAELVAIRQSKRAA